MLGETTAMPIVVVKCSTAFTQSRNGQMIAGKMVESTGAQRFGGKKGIDDGRDDGGGHGVEGGQGMRHSGTHGDGRGDGCGDRYQKCGGYLDFVGR